MRYERHLHLVVAELNHRVKNTLSIVQSFAHQSLRSGNSPEEAGAAFEGRLTALASAHKVLTRENWDNVSLIELVIVVVIIGIIGAFVGGWLFAQLGVSSPWGGLPGTIFVAFIGAVVLLFVLRLIRGGTARRRV